MPSISQKLSQESFFWITSPVLDLGFLSRYIFFFHKEAKLFSDSSIFFINIVSKEKANLHLKADLGP